jgi:hypothetical protein
LHCPERHHCSPWALLLVVAAVKLQATQPSVEQAA